MKKLIVLSISSILLFLAANLSVVRAQPPYIIEDNSIGGHCTTLPGGTWDWGTKTCTLTQNVGAPIQIISDGVTLDGGGYSLEAIPASSDVGISITGLVNLNSNVNVKNLTVKNFAGGIGVTDSSNINLANISLSDVQQGIFLSGSTNNHLENIVLANSIGVGVTGIFLINSTDNAIVGSTISNSFYGINISAGRNNSINNNTLSKNEYGLYLDRSTNNRIYKNNFISNTSQAEDYNGGGSNVFNLDAPTGGNYWSDFDTPAEGCFNTNGDIFCDTPYLLGVGFKDNLPHVYPIGTYEYSGILQPVNSDGSSVFKLGKTIPIKFQLKDASGNYVIDAKALISIAKVNDQAVGTFEEAPSTSSATEGNLFRYDSTSNQYIFNLGTKGLSLGTYEIRILINNETSYYVRISLK